MTQQEITKKFVRFVCDHCGKDYEYPSACAECEAKCLVKKAEAAGLKPKFSVDDIVTRGPQGKKYYCVHRVKGAMLDGEPTYEYDLRSENPDERTSEYETNLSLYCSSGNWEEIIKNITTKAYEHFGGNCGDVEIYFDYPSGGLELVAYIDLDPSETGK